MLVLVEDAPETVAPVYMKAGVDVGREERRKSAQVVEVRSGAGSIPACRRDLPHGGGGGPDAEDQQFAVDAAVAPAGILPCQAQHEQADGADGGRPSRAPGTGPGRMTAR
jgi:hypothetical protein